MSAGGPAPAPPPGAPPARPPPRPAGGGGGGWFTDQKRAVSEMERAAAELSDMLESTEVVAGVEPALDTFERGIRELNQLNALGRAQSIQSLSSAAEKRGGWFSQVSDKVVRRGSRADEEEKDDDTEPASAGAAAAGGSGSSVGWFGGAALTRRESAGSRRRSRGSLKDGEDGGPPSPLSAVRARRSVAGSGGLAAGSLAEMARTNDTFRIVGSLTPGMLQPRRKSAAAAPGRRVSWFGGGGGKGLAGLGLADDGGKNPCPPPGVPPEPGEGGFAFGRTSSGRRKSTGALTDRPGTAPGRSGGMSGWFRKEVPPPQQDTSSTRVTGKIDYTALLSEQNDDLESRRESTKQYKEMLDQVENYQKRMIEHLDQQLVFMGITDDKVKETAAEMALEKGKSAPSAPLPPAPPVGPPRPPPGSSPRGSPRARQFGGSTTTTLPPAVPPLPATGGGGGGGGEFYGI